MPFCQLQQLWCLHHGSTKAHLCSPSFLPYRLGDDLWYAHYGFSVRLRYVSVVIDSRDIDNIYHTYILSMVESIYGAVQAGELLTLFFAWKRSKSYSAGSETKHNDTL